MAGVVKLRNQAYYFITMDALGVQDLQHVLHKTQAERQAVQMELAGQKVETAEGRKHSTELEVQLAAACKQLEFVEKELRVLLHSLQVRELSENNDL